MPHALRQALDTVIVHENVTRSAFIEQLLRDQPAIQAALAAQADHEEEGVPA